MTDSAMALGSRMALGLILVGLLAVGPTAAQTLPANGEVRPPGKAAPTADTARAPLPAPRTAVQQDGSGHAGPGHGRAGKPPPVVTAPGAAHAQKPGKGTKAAGAPVGAGAAAAPITEEDAPLPEPPRVAQDPAKGAMTGMPLPRWASLRSDEVNLRRGPGTRYPIDWVYRRRDLPVQIERENDVWRLIEDQDGVKGWVHAATLTGRRSFVVKGSEQTLRRSASDDAAAVAILKSGVVGRMRLCDAKAAWCEVQVGEYRGYLRRDTLYGIYADEAVN